MAVNSRLGIRALKMHHCVGEPRHSSWYPRFEYRYSPVNKLYRCYDFAYDSDSDSVANENHSLPGQAPVVQTVDNAVHWINLYSVGSTIFFPLTNPVDGDSGID